MRGYDRASERAARLSLVYLSFSKARLRTRCNLCLLTYLS